MVSQLRWCVTSEGHEQRKSRHHLSLTELIIPATQAIWLATLSILKFVFHILSHEGLVKIIICSLFFAAQLDESVSITLFAPQTSPV